jgi:hypothetical protein
MIAVKCDHFDIVSQSVNGQRQVDGKTFASVATLADRLEKLQSENPLFAGISFSPDVEALSTTQMASAC